MKSGQIIFYWFDRCLDVLYIVSCCLLYKYLILRIVSLLSFWTHSINENTRTARHKEIIEKRTHAHHNSNPNNSLIIIMKSTKDKYVLPYDVQIKTNNHHYGITSIYFQIIKRSTWKIQFSVLVLLVPPTNWDLFKSNIFQIRAGIILIVIIS